MSLIKTDISSTYSLSKYWILLYENYKWNFDYQNKLQYGLIIYEEIITNKHNIMHNIFFNKFSSLKYYLIFTWALYIYKYIYIYSMYIVWAYNITTSAWRHENPFSFLF